ncbi:augmin complex subunit dgt5 [Toxorhynchites rutilus septentrionalis]|uniref:augmin complex subunit dgt5 n=1 Tax=Toxorhynchites rutilus septentrionalis TaxID=329112 RepID=UPI00247891A4|nr:augmin complex subunit dgt5 [Toxorhynchites rutilus septentrionalis]
MSLSDEIAHFKLWATKLGCPLEKIPSDETLKKYIRGKQSILFKNITDEVRPRQDTAAIRNNVLVSKIKQYENLGGVLSKDIQRYEKIVKLKAKCSESKARIINSKKLLESITSDIKGRNIQKVQLHAKLREVNDKLALFRAADKSLAKMSAKEVEIKQTIDRLMPVKMIHCTKDKTNANDAIQLCLQYLYDFYSKFPERKQDGSRQAQQTLWSNMKAELKDIPNYLLWTVLMEMKEKQLLEISETNRKQNELEQKVTLSDQDALQVNMAKLCGNHINLFVDLIATKRSVQMTRDDYLAKYTTFSQMLEAKMNLLNTMDDESEEILEDYMLESTSRDYNQGQLEFFKKEIEKKKQEIKMQTQKLDNHEQSLIHLREIYSEIDSYSGRIQEEIQQLNQIKEKITYLKRFSGYTVHNMRQKTANQTMNISEQSMNLTKLENNMLSNVPVYSPATPPPYCDELTALTGIPLVKFNYPSKISFLSICTHISLSTNSEIGPLLLLLPNCFTSAECSLQEVRALIKFDEHVRGYMRDLKPEMDETAVDDERYKQLWIANNEKICEQLNEIDAVSSNTKQTIEKSRVYYNFVLANALRKYVPPKKLFNGRNYREYEGEYMMYYRMINGKK